MPGETSSMAVLESAAGDWIGLTGTAIEIFGVLVIVSGILWATYAFARSGSLRVARIEDRSPDLIRGREHPTPQPGCFRVAHISIGSREHPTSGGESDKERYEAYKFRIGRSLLLGLEVLVAADIVKTIGLDLTVESLGVLAVLVLIRTFLSWSLTVEIEGRWPWQRGRAEESRARANSSSRTVFATSEDVVREATA